MLRTLPLPRNPVLAIMLLAILAAVTVWLARMGAPAHHVLGAGRGTHYYE